MPTVVISGNTETVSSVQTQTEVVTIGIQGPAGISEDEVDYARRTDVVDKTTNPVIMYIGKAAEGTTTATAAWKVKRRTIYKAVSGSFTEGDYYDEWAGGTQANFDQVWDDRATLTYS